MDNTKKIIIVMLLALLLPLASAKFWACFTEGGEINYCNPKTPDRVCKNSLCMFCMGSYNETRNCFNQDFFNRCNNLEPKCSSIPGSTTADLEPPVLAIESPINGGFYNTRSILTDISSNEEASIYYRDINLENPRWQQICKECTSFSNRKSFREGLNNLLVKAMDLSGNSNYYNLSFFIDTKEPIIQTASPKSGFVSRAFSTQFKEENPVSLFLHYGNSSKMLSFPVNISKNCTYENRKYYCGINIPLASFNNQEISFYFNLTDIAGNSDTNKKTSLTADTKEPIINSINFAIEKRALTIRLNITEQNIREANYIDQEDLYLRSRRLCTRLKEGICLKRITFSEGAHNLQINVLDKAGNLAARNISFVV